MIKILFMGRKQVAADCLKFLLNRTDVKVVGVLTDSHLDISVTANLARGEGLPLYTFETALRAIQQGELTFDLGLSMLYWRKLRDDFLTLPELGCVNFHPAPLPEYRGVGGYNLAILEGLDTWAATAHYVDAEIDTGPIIHSQQFPIDPQTETAKSLEKTSQKVLREVFEKTVKDILEQPSRIVCTPNEGGRYLSRPQLEAMKKVDLNTDDLDRKVRAFWFPPYDGAYIEILGEKFTLANRQILQDIADPGASSLFSQPASKRD